MVHRLLFPVSLLGIFLSSFFLSPWPFAAFSILINAFSVSFFDLVLHICIGNYMLLSKNCFEIAISVSRPKSASFLSESGFSSRGGAEMYFLVFYF
jgi:hypothetical protein